MSENNVNNEKIKKYFEKKVRESGHTFEGSIYKILEKCGFSNIRREEFYYDKDENKGRNIDFLTFETNPSFGDRMKNWSQKIMSAQIRFVIECKSLPNHAWIFFGNEDDESDFVHNGEFLVDDDLVDFIFEKIEALNEPEIYFASTHAEYIYADGEKPKNCKDNNLYEASISLTKAITSQVEELQQLSKRMPADVSPLSVVFFQPVIVFGGHMYKAINDETDQVHLSEIDLVKIRRQYVSDKYRKLVGTIHIVSWKKLDEYLKMMREYYWHDDWIKKYQKELMEQFEKSLKKK